MSEPAHSWLALFGIIGINNQRFPMFALLALGDKTMSEAITPALFSLLTP